MGIFEVEYKRHNNGILKCDVEDSWLKPSIGNSNLTCKIAKVEDVTSYPASDEEIMEIEQLLFEPQSEKDLSNYIMLSSGDAEQHIAVEDFPNTAVHLDQRTDFGLLESYGSPLGNQQLKYEFVDRMFRSIDEEGDLQLQSNHPCVSSGFLLDDDLADSSLMDDASQSVSCIRSIKLQEGDRDADEISDLSNAINTLHEATPEPITVFVENTITDELQDDLGSTLECDAYLKNELWIKRSELFGLHDLPVTDNSSSPSQYSLTANEIENELIWTPNSLFEGVNLYGSMSDGNELVSTRDDGKNEHSTEDFGVACFSRSNKGGCGFLNLEGGESVSMSSDRLCKLHRRYIEETSEICSRCCSQRLKLSDIVASDKHCNLAHCQNQLKDSIYEQLCYQDCFSGAVIRKPRNLRARSGCPWKNITFVRKETISKKHILSPTESKATYASKLCKYELQDHISEDWAGAVAKRNCRIRRKHHRAWTLSEVMKLIEGVSRFGVGRWNVIKRVLFSTSAFRTAVDLKDKWRNLLKTSALLLHERKQVEPQKRHMSVHIPQSVLLRIRELSAAHPYPRDRKSASSTPYSASSKGGIN